jgi:hypothetical protein
VQPALVSAAIVPVLLAAGCGSSPRTTSTTLPAPIPTPIGVGPQFQPGAHPTSLGAPKGRLRCTRPATSIGDLAHVELFAEGKVFLVPQGIGVAPPLRYGVQRIVAGRCRYPLATFDRTGTVDFTRPGLTLRDLFKLWGEPLSATRLAGFRARSGTRVHAFVGGVPWKGAVADIPLAHHAEIVVEINSSVPPHSFYLFPR